MGGEPLDLPPFLRDMPVRWPGAAGPSRGLISRLPAKKKKKLVRKLAASWDRETQRANLSPTLFQTFGRLDMLIIWQDEYAGSSNKA